MSPSVAIILVNWKSFEATNDCINSLKKIEYQPYSIVVVDNGSEDGSGSKLKQIHPEIILIESEKNLGFTGGNNLGFQYSIDNGFQYSLMLNNDTFVEVDFLRHLVTAMQTNPSIGGVQPRIHFNHNRSILWNGGSYYNTWLGFLYTKGIFRVPQKDHLIFKEVDWITGCAFLTKNSILQKTGFLAENMFMYGEDVDLSLRIKSLGYSLVYQPQSVIYHIAGMSSKSQVKGKEGFVDPIVQYYNQRNRIWILKKYTRWYCTPTVILCNIFYISLILGYFALRRRFTKFKTVLRAIKDGLNGSIINHPVS